MDLHQLRTFVHVAELGNIRAAAQRLNVAQSALTRQLQSLEGDLGIALLHRHGRGVVPTMRGEIFLERARAILRDVIEAREEVRGEQLDLTGSVGVGIPPELAEAVVPDLMERVAAEMPGITLRFATGYGADCIDRLNGGLLDLAVLCHAVEAPTRKLYRLAQEPLWLITARGDQRPRPGPLPLAEAGDLPLVMPSRRHGLTRLVEDAFASRGGKARIAVEVDDLPLLLSLVARRRGASILPARVLRQAAGEDRAPLDVVPLDPAPVRTLALAVPLDRLPTPAAARVRDLLAATVRHAAAPSGSEAAAQPTLSLIAGRLAALPPKGAHQWHM